MTWLSSWDQWLALRPCHHRGLSNPRMSEHGGLFSKVKCQMLSIPTHRKGPSAPSGAQRPCFSVGDGKTPLLSSFCFGAQRLSWLHHDNHNYRLFILFLTKRGSNTTSYTQVMCLILIRCLCKVIFRLDRAKIWSSNSSLCGNGIRTGIKTMANNFIKWTVMTTDFDKVIRIIMSHQKKTTLPGATRPDKPFEILMQSSSNGLSISRNSVQQHQPALKSYTSLNWRVISWKLLPNSFFCRG